MGGPGGWVPIWVTMEQGFQVRSGWPGWARRNWMGWSWMGWLLHRLKLALKCCGFLADIPSSDCRSSCQCQCELTASVTGPGPGPGPGARVGPGPASMIAA